MMGDLFTPVTQLHDQPLSPPVVGYVSAGARAPRTPRSGGGLQFVRGLQFTL